MPPVLAFAHRCGRRGDAVGKSLIAILGIGLMAAAPATPTRLAGNWGAEGMALRTLTSGAIVQGHCATGKITGAIPIDSDGRFGVRGYFNPQRSGWRLSDVSPRDVPAAFYGVVTGNTLALTIRRSGKPDQKHTLVRDAPTRFVPCK